MTEMHLKILEYFIVIHICTEKIHNQNKNEKRPERLSSLLDGYRIYRCLTFMNKVRKKWIVNNIPFLVTRYNRDLNCDVIIHSTTRGDISPQMITEVWVFLFKSRKWIAGSPLRDNLSLELVEGGRTRFNICTFVTDFFIEMNSAMLCS